MACFVAVNASSLLLHPNCSIVLYGYPFMIILHSFTSDIASCTDTEYDIELLTPLFGFI